MAFHDTVLHNNFHTIGLNPKNNLDYLLFCYEQGLMEDERFNFCHHILDIIKRSSGLKERYIDKLCCIKMKDGGSLYQFLLSQPSTRYHFIRHYPYFSEKGLLNILFSSFNDSLILSSILERQNLSDTLLYEVVNRIEQKDLALLLKNHGAHFSSQLAEKLLIKFNNSEQIQNQIIQSLPYNVKFDEDIIKICPQIKELNYSFEHKSSSEKFYNIFELSNYEKLNIKRIWRLNLLNPPQIILMLMKNQPAHFLYSLNLLYGSKYDKYEKQLKNNIAPEHIQCMMESIGFDHDTAESLSNLFMLVLEVNKYSLVSQRKFLYRITEMIDHCPYFYKTKRRRKIMRLIEAFHKTKTRFSDDYDDTFSEINY